LEVKKFLVLAAVFALIASVLAGGVALAAPPSEGGLHGPAGKSNVAHLYLYQKDPSTWEIIDSGTWGKMTYNLEGPTFDFVFNGHGLTPNTDYSLIYYADPWPGDNPGALIASGMSNNGGQLHLAGSVELNMDLPGPADANYPDGAKIWLVPSSDYDATANKMIKWNPTQYLYEHNLITYDDTDIP
jgi:hypothetical protein